MESCKKTKDFKIVLLTANPATKTSMFDKFDKILNSLPEESFKYIDSLSSICLERELKDLNRTAIAKNMSKLKDATIIFYHVDKAINQNISLFLNSSKEILDKSVLLLDFNENKPNVDFSGFQYNMVYEFGLFVLNYSDSESISKMIVQKMKELSDKIDNEKESGDK